MQNQTKYEQTKNKTTQTHRYSGQIDYQRGRGWEKWVKGLNCTATNGNSIYGADHFVVYINNL